MRSYSDAKARLLNIPGTVTSTQWSLLVNFAAPETVLALDEAISGSGAFKDSIIIGAVSRGHNYQANKLGKNGQIKPSTTRYVHHVISVAEVLVRAQFHADDNQISYIFPALRSFDALRREYGNKRGPLSKKDERKARAMTLFYCLKMYPNPEQLELFSSNFDVLEKYLETFAQNKDLSVATVSRLLASQPEQALAEGAL